MAVLPQLAAAQIPRPVPGSVPGSIPGSPGSIPGEALPQEAPSRPVRPLFGSAVGRFDQTLSTGFTFGGGYDVERVTYDPLAGAGAGDELVTRGPSGFGNLQLAYGVSGGRFSGGASVRGAGFFYRRLGTGVRLNSGATVHGGLQLWQSASVSATHDVFYAPYQFTAMTPEEIFQQQQINPNFVPSTIVPSTLQQRSSLRFGQGFTLSRRVSAYLTYGLHADGQAGYWGRRQEMGGGLSFGIARGLGAHLGYRYTLGYATSPGAAGSRSGLHNIDSGIDFNRRLSLSRRLDLSFRTGFASYGDQGATHFTAVGGAWLGWAISRQWRASTGVYRDVQFYDDLHAVAVANGVHAGLQGTLTRSLSLHGSVGMSSMDRGYGTGDSRSRWTSASVGLSKSLSSLLSIGVDYTNAYYSFGDDVALYPGVPRHRHRQAVTGSVTVAAPLFTMTRRP